MNARQDEVRSWRRSLLPASLLLNLFLLALIGGHLWRRHASETLPEAPSLARALAGAEASLSAKDAAAFGAVMRRDAPHYLDSARQLAEARRALERQIVADPFNQEAAKQAFAAWESSSNRFLEDIGNTLVEALGQVSPQGRQKLVAERRRARPDLRTP